MNTFVHNGKKLNQLKPGSSGIISSFTDSSLAARLMSMGLMPGSKVSYIRKAPFGNGLYIQFDNHFIALRKQEAACIQLK